MSAPPALVSARQLQQMMAEPGSRVVPVCAAWFMPNAGRTGRDSFLAGRIPGARFLDIDEVKDKTSSLPHMLPGVKGFATAMGRMGIGRDDKVVVYDSAELGIFSAPRAAWMFWVFGHADVSILDNFRLWTADGLPLESGPVKDEPIGVPYSSKLAALDRSKVATFDQVRLAIQSRRAEQQNTDLSSDDFNALSFSDQDIVILDARSNGRWAGTEPEPRPGLPSGHMPGSISIPFTQVLDPDTKSFLSPDKLADLFISHGLRPDRKTKVISTCGTGVTAAILDTALHLAGFRSNRRKLYDGSWTEWASRARPDEIERENPR